MKRLASVVVATLVLAVVAPAWAQEEAKPAARTVEPKFKLTFTGTFTPTESVLVTLAYAYVNLHTVGGIDWQIGFAPLTLGHAGLLFDADPTAGHVRADVPFGRFTLTGMVVRGGTPPPDISWIFRAETSTAGAVFGLNYLSEVAAGVSSSGWSADIAREILPGVTLQGDYASFTPAGGTAATAYQADAALELATLFGLEALSPVLTLAYRDATTDFVVTAPPAATNADDWRGWSAELGLTLNPRLDATITFESGNDIDTGGVWNGIVLELVSAIAPRMELTLTYTYVTIGGVEFDQTYEAKLSYEWD